MQRQSGGRATRAALWTLACSTLLMSSGCAAFKASTQPGKKDVSVLSPGMPRNLVIAEIGAPVWSEERNGVTTDIFDFRQGYSKKVKAGRAMVHVAGDVVTGGLWEIVGIPAETLADGTEVKVEVQYDFNRVVRAVHVIEGEKIVASRADPDWHPPQPVQTADATEVWQQPTSGVSTPR